MTTPFRLTQCPRHSRRRNNHAIPVAAVSTPFLLRNDHVIQVASIGTVIAGRLTR
ncbi:hypothetical protein [Bartonella choladocola]|uniref:hypothetical protein n=1 Tax=Bartonella choladocola TaxID=2750995 RepID=UPI0016623778|nr:hypothetical protein [Bartonella choladocola]